MRATRSATRMILTAAALATVLVVTPQTDSAAEATVACSLSQITSSTGLQRPFGRPRISGDGRYVVMSSTADPSGDNSDHNSEIFRYDRVTGTMRQITVTSSLFQNLSPSVDADGNRIAFLRQESGAPSTDNTDVMLWKDGRAGKSIVVPVTSSDSPVTNVDPDVSASGGLVAYVSTSGGTNAVHVWSSVTSIDSVRTADTTHRFSLPQIADDDRSVVALARAGAVPFGTPAPVDEVVVLGIDEMASRTVARNVSIGSLAVDSSGNEIVYSSTTDIDGHNPAGANQLVFTQANVGTRTPFTATTSGVIGPNTPAIDAAGTRVVYATDSGQDRPDPAGYDQIVMHDIGAPGTDVRITDGIKPSLTPDIDDSGRYVVFLSASNLTGSNPSQLGEVFLATCGAPPVPAECAGAFVTVDLRHGDQPTKRNDVIRGTDEADVVSAGRGSDVICGNGGRDVLDGGPGNDKALGGPGRDRLIGAGGKDVLVGGGGKDTCAGGKGHDVALGCEVATGVP